MIISGNTAYQVDEEGTMIEEPYTPEEGCVWENMGMCRGCPVCQYQDYYDEKNSSEF